MTDQTELQQAQADLRRLSRMLGEFEIARDLVDVYGMPVVSEALSMVEAAETSAVANKVQIVRSKALEELAVDDAKRDFAQREPAMKDARGGIKKIELMKNRTPVKFNGVQKDPTKSFNDAADKVSKISSAMSENGLPWIKRKPSADMIATIKMAVLKSREAQRENVTEAFLVNKTAMEIMRARIALNEGNNTVAAKTIETNYKAPSSLSAAEPRLQTELPAIRMPDYDTRAMLPPEFSKIESTKDRSFSAMTKAAKTLDRSKNFDTVVPNPETNAQGEVADKFYGAGKSRPEPATVKNSGPDSYSETQKRKTREGQWPADPATPWYPEATASSRSPGSRW